MLCITGNEQTTAALETRLANTPACAIAELRLDLLTEPLDAAFDLIARHGPKLIVCLRPTRQGGGYDGGERERLRLLGRAMVRGPAHIDIEGDCDDPAISALRAIGLSDVAGQRTTKIVLSWHEFAPEPEMRAAAIARAEALDTRDADILKLAVSVSDPVDLEDLLSLSERLIRPAILLGMGAAGRISRARYPLFGSPWTYLSETELGSTAAGQLTLEDATKLGLPLSADAPFFALVGGPQVAHSPGPTVYNALFRQRGLRWAYHAIATHDAERCFGLLARLGARGLSVTMPHKLAALSYAVADAIATKTGAANTLRFTESGAEATNTDVAGVIGPLAAALAKTDDESEGYGTRRALILGAGGAARAAVVACRQLGLLPIVSARRAGQARAIDGAAEVVPWEARAKTAATVLVNATPLSGAASPLPMLDSARWPIVFDLALAAQPSALLAQAAARGAQAIVASEMWLHQAAAQLAFLGAGNADVETLRCLLP